MGQRHTILIVEDHPQLRGLLAETLDAAGYQVVEAWNGAQAISAIDEHLPPHGHRCLILLDLRLPYGSGLDVLQYLAGRGTYVPVVAISADTELLKAAEASGAQATVSKPFDLDDVLATVSRYCPLGPWVNDQAG
jgi:two-component system KDP operon response regulator KdpE